MLTSFTCKSASLQSVFVAHRFLNDVFLQDFQNVLCYPVTYIFITVILILHPWKNYFAL